MTGRIARQLNFPIDMFITSKQQKKNDKDLSFFLIIVCLYMKEGQGRYFLSFFSSSYQTSILFLDMT